MKSNVPGGIRVAVCIPSGDDWKAFFAISLIQMMDWTTRMGGGIDLDLHNVRMTVLSESRHRLVQSAIAGGATHVLFLDSDMTFPPDTLLRLLAHDKDIVGAICPTRRSLRPPSNVQQAQPGTPKSTWTIVPPDPKGGLLRVTHVGTAVLLLRTSVFGKIEQPWFPNPWSADQNCYLGEDVGFCARMNEAGVELYADMSFSYDIGHCGQHVYSLRGPIDSAEFLTFLRPYRSAALAQDHIGLVRGGPRDDSPTNATRGQRPELSERKPLLQAVRNAFGGLVR